MSEEEIFHQARARTDPEERAAYLEQACGDDAALRASVEALLRADVGASGFMERPPPNAGRDRRCADRRAPRYGDRPVQAAPADRRGRHGHRLHGRADRSRSGARSPLKVIKPGMDTRQVIARFEAERQALALMDHPNIAQVLDAGATADRPAVLRHGAGQGRADHPSTATSTG